MKQNKAVKKKCEDCGIERSRLMQVYKDDGGYHGLCTACAMKYIKPRMEGMLK